ncbi:hypothetical protein OG857_29380 [Streptomyces cyaneofuscatus]|uniref:Eco57I restriction-modification methylase domain-containing protein n=1 Tax=Streptomyces cyaneofuscatus TaxID=66883 RepID=UPI002DDB5006|nr:DNA methyltransferase [Streptomyces cyaneofuscatus]WSD49643.1 hypothetical protein OG857_29380 [Streptomyces cyaneofuscatus]
MSARPTSRGLAAARAQALDGRRQHQEWLDLTEVSGPFLTMPVLRRAWPQLDAVEKSERTRLRAHHADWQSDTTAGRDEWVAYILRSLLGWDDALTLREGESDDPALDRLTLHVPEHNAVLRPDFALVEPGTDLTAEPDTASAAKRVRLLGTAVPAGTAPTSRAAAGSDWAAAPADRLARLLRHHDIPLGLVTDGRWWCLVWAPIGGVTTTAVFDTIGWNEAAERNVVRAFVSLLRRRRFFEYEEAETLVGLLRAGLAAGEDVTEALGIQVRQAVELLVDAIGRADVRAMEAGAPGLHASGVAAGEVYRGAVAVMMRVVFLLYAEERGLLPADNEVYATAYSARFLRTELKARADADGESALEHTTSAWHRLIALFHAVHGGVDHPELRLPAYDGSIFAPETYAWLELTTPLLPIDDRTVLHMLQSVQEVRVGTGRNAEVRTVSFRALDVEQIGYVYEGLLSYGGERAVEDMVGLIGPEGLEHEVPLRELESLAARSGGSVKALATSIHERWKDPKAPASASKLEKLLAPAKDEVEARRQLNAVTKKNSGLSERLLPFLGILRRDLRGLPMVIPNGSLFVTESSLRKNTGTHYTPRFLAEDVVRHTLEPLVYEPGPLQTADTGEWRLKSPEQILKLKVADIAMGSAAFLVAACRYLGDRLIEAWENEGRTDAMTYRAGRAVDAVTAADAEQDAVVVEARRQIIEHCLYGVDINPMAVEMAKLSLWLVSMDPTRPFTFLDDRLVAGDSLLGVHSMEQLQSVDLRPKRQYDVLAEQTRELVDQLTEERLAITAIRGVDLPALRRKRAGLAEVNRHSRRLRLVGDLIAGAALATCASGRVEWYAEDGGDRVRDFVPQAAWIVEKIVAEGVEEDSDAVHEARATAEEWLGAELPAGGLERRPVHWPLVFPEVFTRTGGFDAIVGNPPFLGGQKLTGTMGEAYREYMVDHLAAGKRGSADLVAYFELRAHQLLNTRGQTGLIATNTLAQGDTREVGLDQLEAKGVTIRRAVKSERWPSKSAALEYCAVWTTVPALGEEAGRTLDGLAVRGITTSLDPQSRVSGRPYRLVANLGKSFQGAIVLGKGFIVSPEQAQDLIQRDSRNQDVLFPYLNGEDLNSRPDCSASRWVINFHDWPEERAREYPEVFAIVDHHVKPERLKNNRKIYRDNWWQYAEKRPAMLKAIRDLDRVLVVALVSRTVMPVLAPTGQVFSHMLGVFASRSTSSLALLDSSIHYAWATARASSLKGDLRYTPSDVYETMPQPRSTEEMKRAGQQLEEFRDDLMKARSLGLTKLYGLFHSPSEVGADVNRLRSLHYEIDLAVAEAYGWGDLNIEPAFNTTRQGIRFSMDPRVRVEVLDRMLELNHDRQATAKTERKISGNARAPLEEPGGDRLF